MLRLLADRCREPALMSIPSAILFAAPDCDVGLLRQLLWHFPAGTRAYVHHSQRWLDPSSLFIPQQQRSRSRGRARKRSPGIGYALFCGSAQDEREVKMARRTLGGFRLLWREEEMGRSTTLHRDAPAWMRVCRPVCMYVEYVCIGYEQLSRVPNT